MLGHVQELSTQECWAILAEGEFGRLAYHLQDHVQLTPLNYALADRRIVFRTNEGSKLSSILRNGDVAFETDDISNEQATSVIARGRAVELHGDEAAMVDQLRLRPWVPSVKRHVIAIEVSEVSGRRFELAKPWTHIVPQ